MILALLLVIIHIIGMFSLIKKFPKWVHYPILSIDSLLMIIPIYIIIDESLYSGGIQWIADDLLFFIFILCIPIIILFLRILCLLGIIKNKKVINTILIANIILTILFCYLYITLLNKPI